MDGSDVTTGELGRRVDRLESTMTTGFATISEQLRTLQFVPAGVYASDRSGDQERINRLEADLRDEREAREQATRDATAVAGQRAWQAKLALITAIVGIPASTAGAVLVAYLTGR